MSSHAIKLKCQDQELHTAVGKSTVLMSHCVLGRQSLLKGLGHYGLL